MQSNVRAYERLSAISPMLIQSKYKCIKISKNNQILIDKNQLQS